MSEDSVVTVASGQSEDASRAKDRVDGRQCGYSGCRAKLPPYTGRGNRPLYCQDGKVWGSKKLTCKQAGQAEENYRSLHGEQVLADTSITDLGAHLDRALGPVEALRSFLEGFRDDVNSVVAEAVAEKDAAAARAIDAQGRAEVDHERAVQAEQEAEQARQRAFEATRRADEADEARNEALSEAERMRIRMNEAHTREARAEDNVRDAYDRMTEAEKQLATALAEQHSLEQRLTQALAERDTARHQADEAEDQARAQIQQYQQQSLTDREQHAIALAQAREEAHAQITAAREQAEAAIASARAEFDQTTAGHTALLTKLHQQLGANDQQITNLTARAEKAEQAQQQATAQLQRFRDHLSTALAGATEKTSSRELATHLRTLLNPDSDQVRSEA